MFRTLIVLAIGLSVAACTTATPPGSPPATTVTATTTSTPTQPPPSPTLSEPSPSPTRLPFLGNGPLSAGTYRINYLLPLRVTVTVPSNWEAVQDWALGAFDGHAYLALYRVQNVYADPCQWQGTEYDPPIGRSGADLIAAMERFPERSPTEPVDVTVAGRTAKMIEWTVPLDVDFADCDLDQYRSWTKSSWREDDFGVRYHQAPGQVDRIYVLAIDGERLVVDETWEPTVTSAQRAELDAVVATLTIDTP